jgi:hypothetical protein
MAGNRCSKNVPCSERVKSSTNELGLVGYKLLKNRLKSRIFRTGYKKLAGLLNLPALFALADFQVFSVIYAALSCTKIASVAA